jgi:hypothetical protein
MSVSISKCEVVEIAAESEQARSGLVCEISRSHGGEYEDDSLPVYIAV